MDAIPSFQTQLLLVRALDQRETGRLMPLSQQLSRRACTKTKHRGPMLNVQTTDPDIASPASHSDEASANLVVHWGLTDN